MTSSNTGPFGHFRYDVGSDTWWWSDPVYEIHGFTPGEIVPTTELILSHKHPDDVAHAERTISTALARGDSFALWHRVLDAHRRLRQVVSVGGGVHDESGRVSEVQGFMIDVSEPHRRAAAEEIDEAVRASAQTRGDIEQAKGALMFVYGLDAETAFDVLRRYSQRNNVKVRDVARLLTHEMAQAGGMPWTVRRLFDETVGDATPADATPAEETPAEETVADETVPDASSADEARG